MYMFLSTHHTHTPIYMEASVHVRYIGTFSLFKNTICRPGAFQRPASVEPIYFPSAS